MSTKSYQFKLATDAQEIAAYFALRCSIFAEEQQLFQGNDVDEIDLVAYPIVALATDTNQVVGVVRIYEVESGIWYGGRLGTHRDYRKGWQIGKGLIYKAVTTANAWGAIASSKRAITKRALLSAASLAVFEEITICDCTHHLMEADLNFYPQH
jgi:putative N-acetyltransferase (TIGR04045 family)